MAEGFRMNARVIRNGLISGWKVRIPFGRHSGQPGQEPDFGKWSI
jgi:hypothetical protein